MLKNFRESFDMSIFCCNYAISDYATWKEKLSKEFDLYVVTNKMIFFLLIENVFFFIEIIYHN